MQTGAAKVRSSSASFSRVPKNRVRGLRPSRKRPVGVTSLPTYGPRWGNRFAYDGAASDQRYPGQYFDAESGLHYNYFRDYDPKTGRYIEPDPIGRRGGPNVYAYAKNNPMGLIDIFGLKDEKGCCDEDKKKEGYRRCEVDVMNLCRENIIFRDNSGKIHSNESYCKKLVEKCKSSVDKACGCNCPDLEKKIKDKCPVGSIWNLYSDGLPIDDWIDCADNVIRQNCK